MDSMTFLDLANNRYTTKKYNSEKTIDAHKVEQLQNILRLSPSSINSQPWKFIFISDPKLKSKLASMSHFNEEKVNEASHLVVFRVIDDIRLFEEQNLPNLPEGAVWYYNQYIKPKSEEAIKGWFTNQVYLSLGFFLSACAEMSIDSTPMEGINAEEYDNILNAPGYKTLFAATIGYRDSSDSNQPSITPKSRLQAENVIQFI